jgi:hypothetical protein
MHPTPSNRSFLTRTFARRDEGGNTEAADSKGPCGLNTLFEPLESVVADLVFVHGLNGGSRSTWTRSLDPSLFWPEEWLPQDEGFKDVRIHSFGYDSNWGKESTLNIHDFAKALLGSIQDCPAIPQGPQVRTFHSTATVIALHHGQAMAPSHLLKLIWFTCSFS